MASTPVRRDMRSSQQTKRLATKPPRTKARSSSLSSWGTQLLRFIAAAFSGVMIFAAYQPTGLWWAAPLGMAVFFLAVNPQRSIALAWIQGLVTYALLLPWVGEFVGASAWIALAVIQSLYSLLFGVGLKGILSSRDRFTTKLPVRFFLISSWFVAVEFVRSHWPFGGFPWGRLAWGQVGGPMAFLITLGGPAVVTFAVVFLGGLVSVLVGWAIRFIPTRSRPITTFSANLATHTVRPLTAAATVAVILLLGGGLQLSHPSSGSSVSSIDDASLVNVAAIQGNVPRLGLDFNSQRRAVLDNHAKATAQLVESISEGEAPQPDVVIWPENASDVNPFTDAHARSVITDAQHNAKAPILVGTVSPEHNTMVVFGENGPGDRHIKKYLQPFGEYMPFRDMLRKITPLVDQAGNFQPGDDNGVVMMKSQAGRKAGTNIPVGVATCYEVSFDGAFRSAVRGGAQLLTSPTNNATFGFTEMTYQQLAMSRMRAIEYDRTVVVAATSGVSAIVEPNGNVVTRSNIFTRDVLQASVPLRETMTVSARVGPWVEWVVAGFGALTALTLFIVARRNGSRSHNSDRG